MSKKNSSLKKESLPSESTPVQIVPPQSWSPYAGEDDTIDLFELINTLWKRKLLILVISLLSLAGSFVSTQFLPKTYTSSVLFEYPDWKELAQSVKNPIILDGIVRRNQIINNFLKSCNVEPNWDAADILHQIDIDVKESVGNEKVLLALSGGVDSTVLAAVLYKIIGKNLTCVMVDHGLLRKDEAKNVIANLYKKIVIIIKDKIQPKT